MRQRGLVALLLAAALVLGVAPPRTQAAPSHRDLSHARAKLQALVRQQGALVEAYDGARVKLAEVTAELTRARVDLAGARAAAARDHAIVDQAAVSAYEAGGTQVSMLLGSSSITEFADRLETLQAISARSNDAALKAGVAEQQARAASARLAAAVRQRTAILHTLAQKRRQIVASIAAQRALVAKMVRQIRNARRRAAAARRIQQNLIPAAPAPASGGEGGSAPPAPSGGGAPGPLPPPPPSGSGAAVAVAAARSVLGVPYVWGGASPQTGFDCSGLTMWAWAHAGVSMPHFAAAQYAMFPKVPRSDLQPGDLVFFYPPAIDHVGIYIGNGLMIDAPYTGTVVRVDPVYWNVYVGAVRP